MASSYTPEQLAMLRAQVEHFASAEHVRREVDVWRDHPEERLAELDRMCEENDALAARGALGVRLANQPEHQIARPE